MTNPDPKFPLSIVYDGATAAANNDLIHDNADLFVPTNMLRNVTKKQMMDTIATYFRVGGNTLIYLGHADKFSHLACTDQHFNSRDLSGLMEEYFTLSRGGRLLEFANIACQGDAWIHFENECRQFSKSITLVTYPTSIRNPQNVTVAQDKATVDMIRKYFKL